MSVCLCACVPSATGSLLSLKHINLLKTDRSESFKDPPFSITPTYQDLGTWLFSGYQFRSLCLCGRHFIDSANSHARHSFKKWNYIRQRILVIYLQYFLCSVSSADILTTYNRVRCYHYKEVLSHWNVTFCVRIRF